MECSTYQAPEWWPAAAAAASGPACGGGSCRRDVVGLTDLALWLSANTFLTVKNQQTLYNKREWLSARGRGFSVYEYDASLQSRQCVSLNSKSDSVMRVIGEIAANVTQPAVKCPRPTLRGGLRNVPFSFSDSFTWHTRYSRVSFHLKSPNIWGLGHSGERAAMKSISLHPNS